MRKRNDIYSNFRLFGLGKETPAQTKRRTVKDIRKEAKKAYESLETETKMPDAVPVDEEKLIKTNAIDAPKSDKKFLGMKRKVGIPVTIAGIIVVSLGLYFLTKNKN